MDELYQGLEQGWTYLWTLPDKATQWFAVTDAAAMQARAAELARAGQNVYFGVGVAEAPKQKGRAGNADVIGIPGVWMDLDLKHDSHKEQNLPATLTEIRGKLPLEPTVIVHSGHGVHLYWLFKEAWMFDTPGEKKQAEGLLRGFQGYVRDRLGYKLDATHDLARVLRLPGTRNLKQPAAPKPVEVIEQSGVRYNIDDLDQFAIEPAPAGKPGPDKRKGFKRFETDGPAAFVIDNCKFIQHCKDNAATLTEPEWVAMLSNIARCKDGERAAHELSAPYPGYTPAETDQKIDHVLGGMGPATCQYIQSTLGFQDCPSTCEIKSPCCWAVEEVPRVIARVRGLAPLTVERVYEVLGDLAVLQKKNTAELGKFKARCRAEKISVSDLQKAITEKIRKTHNLQVIDGGASLEQPHSDGKRKTCAFVRDTPLDLNIPDGFEYRIDGVQQIKEDALTGNLIYHTASWNPVIISAHIENVDAQGEKLELSFKSRGKWKKTICKRSDAYIARNLALLSDAGLGVSSETARVLVKYLQALETANVTEIPRKKAVSKLGWRDRESTFVLPGIESGYEIDLGGGMETKITGFKQSGDFGEWLAKMKEVRTRPKARLIMAAAFAAPLLKIVSQRSFAIHNWNDTRGGKTAAQHAALSVWGKPGDIARTFDDTRTSLERTAALYTDLLLGINEYELLSNKKKEGIDSMIYQICEGQGRGRGTVAGLQETAVWRTVAITNGESQIIQDSTKGGVFTRLIEVKGGPLADDDMFASSLYPFTAKNHGHAGKIFIEKLLQGGHDEIRETYNRTREALRAKHPEKIPSHLDIMACIASAEYYADMWIFGLAEAQAGVESIQMVEAAIEDLPVLTDSDESARAWEWLPDWIAANERKFESFPSMAFENVGCKDDDYYYINKTQIKEAMKAAGFNATKILGVWADQGKFPCFVDRNNHKRTLGIKSGTPYTDKKIRPWLIRIPISLSEEI